MLLEQIIKYSRYNVWANQRIINSILAAGEESADKEMPSSFTSVRKTLYHIHDAESIWLCRLKNEDSDWPASKHFKGTLNESCKLIIEKSNEFANYVSSLSENDLLNVFEYKNIAGKEFSNERKDAIMHCMNHSTFHRGQLVTMLRNAGHTQFEPMDFIAFCRE